MKTPSEIAIDWCPNSDSYFSWELHNVGKCCESCAKLVQLINEVILVERERCAKIALSLCSDDTTQCEREGENGCRARRISLMIRKG